MRDLKMFSLLSVGNASEQPSKLIVVEYNGSAPLQQPIVLVGKASPPYRWDKPQTGMDEMKFDMCGGIILGSSALSGLT